MHSPIEKLTAVRTALKAAFVERDEVIDGVLTAIIANEHILLLGPPGTAKSAMVNALAGAIDGGRCFTRLLTKFSTPEELFGPVSLAALKADRFRRQTDGYLPDAHIGFVDECFKGSSSILNTLLTLMQERKFDNDGQRQDCPLLTLVGASNELPDGQELDAFFDRFLVKFWIGYVTNRDRLKTLLASPNGEPNITEKLTVDDIRELRSRAQRMTVPDAVIELIINIKSSLEHKGLIASDRTWRKLVRLAQARAVLDGADCDFDEVDSEHLEVLADSLWREPSQRALVVAEVGKYANPIVAEAQQLLDAVRENFAKFPSKITDDNMAVAARINREVKQIAARGAELMANAPAHKAGRLREAMGEIQKLHGAMIKSVQVVSGT